MTPTDRGLSRRLDLPGLRADRVQRRRVTDLLAARDRPIVLVVAPAGFGKTTAIVDWLEATDHPVCWHTVEAHEDNLHALFAGLAATSEDEARDRSIRRLKVILSLAALACAIAALAGLIFLVVDPASGSTTEAVIGFTAAIAGLSTGALLIGAVIYAQSRNLWHLAPGWVRWVVVALVAAGVVRSIVSWIG
jgi:LuxR family maltose regulon positive regulatory protein